MDWVEKMKAGMQMIQFACEHITVCKHCPFYGYCNELSNEYDIPEKWDLEEKENKK